MSTYSWPRTLVPDIFRRPSIVARLETCHLYQATARGKGPHLDPTYVLKDDSRMGVGNLFSPMWFSSDPDTAEAEFRYRYSTTLGEIWRINATLNSYVDLENPELGLPDGFLSEQRFFQWQFLAACVMGAGIEGSRFTSFRGKGLNYAIFSIGSSSSLSLLDKVRDIE